MSYKTIIGLEVHVELATKTKTFCSCANDGIGAMPNTLTCPVCLGLPGSIPKINKHALELTIQAALLINSKIANKVMFERKNFYSPDMPKGYQICQLTMPIGKGGAITLSTGKEVGINRTHLEEDAGKVIYDGDQVLIDYNRSGAPILEIVSEPTEMTVEEVQEFLETLRHTLMFGGVSQCRMEMGEFRFDVNISISDNDKLGTRIELKNLTSSKTLASAIEYEQSRQIEALKKGEKLEQETRVWSEEFGKTYVVRAKENINDYRHFPDPDLQIVTIAKSDIERLKRELPESYASRVSRYLRYGFNEQQISLLTSSKMISDYMDRTCEYTEYREEVYNWISVEMLRVYREMSKMDFETIIPAEELSKIVNMVMTDQITRTNAKILFDQVVSSGRSVETIVKEQELLGDITRDEIAGILTQIFSNCPELLQELRSNKDGVSNHVIGLVKDITNGRAVAKDILVVIEDILD